ncbi:SPOR domain-containing protein [Acidisphaera sp. S103]|uniref:SPOR domain-containing protein n=1 Tax=Acidisphaera sp. S103 TaxID=1747223 RepID=UPI00131E911E|nr:SPOR domain-containing protein [Acidisphaera sp. S103]
MSDDLSIPNPDYRGNRAGRYGTGQTRQRSGMDPDTRRLMMFAGGVGAVLVVLIGLSAVIGHHSEGVPVITADTNPVRIKPANPGGLKIDGAENDVFSGGSDMANAKLAATSESPDTRALRSAAALPAPPAARPAAATPSPATKPTTVATAEPAAKPAATIPAAPVAKPRVAAVESHPPVTGHQAMVQLAALSSEEAARNEWKELAKRFPGLMNGKQPIFSHAERDGHTFWRLRTSGFADVAQARTFCDQVRQKGGGCSVADF